MTNEGPPATISGGICDNGQFSILIICKLVQSANSNGRECRLQLSLMYKHSKFSRVPISSGRPVRLFSPTLKCVKLIKCLKLNTRVKRNVKIQHINVLMRRWWLQYTEHRTRSTFRLTQLLGVKQWVDLIVLLGAVSLSKIQFHLEVNPVYFPPNPKLGACEGFQCFEVFSEIQEIKLLLLRIPLTK